MDIKKVKALVDLVTSSGISELEITEEGHSLKIVGQKNYVDNAPVKQVIHNIPTAQNTEHQNSNQILQNNINVTPSNNAPESINKKVVLSPMVGTFYRSSSPSNPAFVELGQSIESGMVVCIIEAMKLMNQIESEFSGKITRIFVENSSPVEYGQPLFEIE